MSLDAASAIVALSEGVIPEFGITIVGFINSDGEEGFKYATHGESNVANIVGLMEMCSHDMLHSANSYDE